MNDKNRIEGESTLGEHIARLGLSDAVGGQDLPRDTATGDAPAMEKLTRLIVRTVIEANTAGSAENLVREILEPLRRDLDVSRYDHATAIHAIEREREYRKILWAACASVWPKALEIDPRCLDSYDSACEIHKAYRPGIRSVAFFSLSPADNHPSDLRAPVTPPSVAAHSALVEALKQILPFAQLALAHVEWSENCTPTFDDCIGVAPADAIENWYADPSRYASINVSEMPCGQTGDSLRKRSHE